MKIIHFPTRMTRIIRRSKNLVDRGYAVVVADVVGLPASLARVLHGGGGRDAPVGHGLGEGLLVAVTLEHAAVRKRDRLGGGLEGGHVGVLHKVDGLLVMGGTYKCAPGLRKRSTGSGETGNRTSERETSWMPHHTKVLF